MPYGQGGDWTNVVGGLATGFAQGKAQQQQFQMMEDYKKAQTDLIKQQAKHQEALVNLEQQKFNMFAPILQGAMGGQAPGGMIPPGGPGIGPGMPQSSPFGPPPMAPSAPRPVPGPGSALPGMSPFASAAPPGSLPNQIAQAQTGLVQMSPEGQKSTRYNNPFNVEYRPWQDVYGAQKGEDNRFGKYPSPVAGVAAATDLIQKYAQQGLTLAGAIEKFAPTSENPNTPQRIAATANALGVSPNTPLANVPLAPFMMTHVKYESPTEINPAIFGDAANAPIGQTIGTNPVINTMQGQAGQVTPGPGQQQSQRAITQRDALNAAWKFFTGSELKDRKLEFKPDKQGNMRVFDSESGNLLKTIDGGPDIDLKDIPGRGLAFVDKNSQRMTNFIPYPPEMVKVEGTTSGGQPYTGYMPKPQYQGQQLPGLSIGGQPAIPGAQGQAPAGLPPGVTGMVTGPSPQEMPGTLPAGAKDKIAQNNSIIDQLNIMKSTFKPEYIGAKGMIGSAADKLSGVVEYPQNAPGGSVLAPDPARATFTTIYNEMLGQKLHERGGSALTKQEIAYIQNTLPRLTQSPDLFNAGIEGAKLILQASNFETMAAHLTPDKAKYEAAATDLVNQYKTQIKPLMEQGIRSGAAKPQTVGLGTPAPVDRNAAIQELRRRGLIQ